MPAKIKNKILNKLTTAIQQHHEANCNQLLEEGKLLFSLTDWQDILIKFIETNSSLDIATPINTILNKISASYTPHDFLKYLQVTVMRINWVEKQTSPTLPKAQSAPSISIRLQISAHIMSTENAILQAHPYPSMPPASAVEDAVEYIILHYIKSQATMHAIDGLRDIEKTGVYLTNQSVVKKLFIHVLGSIKEILSSKTTSRDEKMGYFLPMGELFGRLTLVVEETHLKQIIRIPEQLDFIRSTRSAYQALNSNNLHIHPLELLESSQQLSFDCVEDYTAALSPLFAYPEFLSDVTYTNSGVEDKDCLIITGRVNTQDNTFTLTNDSGLALTVTPQIFLQELDATLRTWHSTIQYTLHDDNQFIFIIPYEPCTRRLPSTNEQKALLLNAIAEKSPAYIKIFQEKVLQQLVKLRQDINPLITHKAKIRELFIKNKTQCIESLRKIRATPLISQADWESIIISHQPFKEILSLHLWLNNPPQHPDPFPRSGLDSELEAIYQADDTITSSLNQIAYEITDDSLSLEDLKKIKSRLAVINATFITTLAKVDSFYALLGKKTTEFNAQLDTLYVRLKKILDKKTQTLLDKEIKHKSITKQLEQWSEHFVAHPGIAACTAIHTELSILIQFTFTQSTVPTAFTYREHNFSATLKEYLITLKKILMHHAAKYATESCSLEEPSITEDSTSLIYQCRFPDTDKPQDIFNRTNIEQELTKTLWHSSKEYRQQYKNDLSQRCKTVYQQLKTAKSELRTLCEQVTEKETNWTTRRDSCFAQAQLVKQNYDPRKLNWKDKPNATKMIKSLNIDNHADYYRGSTFCTPIHLKLNTEFTQREKHYESLQTQLMIIETMLERIEANSDCLPALAAINTSLDQLKIEQLLTEQKNKNQAIAARIDLYENYCKQYEKAIETTEEELKKQQQQAEKDGEERARKNQQKKLEKEAAQQSMRNARQKRTQKPTPSPIHITEIVSYLSQLQTDFNQFARHFSEHQAFSYFSYDYFNIRTTITSLVNKYALLDQETLHFLFPVNQVTTFITEIKTLCDTEAKHEVLDKRVADLIEQFIFLTEVITKSLAEHGCATSKMTMTSETPAPSPFWQKTRAFSAGSSAYSKGAATFYDRCLSGLPIAFSISP